MRSPTCFILGAILFLALAPSASATECTDVAVAGGSLCTYEEERASGTCDEGSESHATYVWYDGPLVWFSFLGIDQCMRYDDAGFSQWNRAVSAHVMTTPTGSITVTWWAWEHHDERNDVHRSYCDTDVWTGYTDTVSLGCPVGGPPQGLPWGSLLP